MNLLENKAKLLKKADASVIFATVFHYYNYDSKVNMGQENCDAFKTFVEQAALDNVSIIRTLSLNGNFRSYNFPGYADSNCFAFTRRAGHRQYWWPRGFR